MGQRARFDRIFARRTGFAGLDRLLERLHANKPELLMALDQKTGGEATTGRREVVAAEPGRTS